VIHVLLFLPFLLSIFSSSYSCSLLRRSVKTARCGTKRTARRRERSLQEQHNSRSRLESAGTAQQSIRFGVCRNSTTVHHACSLQEQHNSPSRLESAGTAQQSITPGVCRNSTTVHHACSLQEQHNSPSRLQSAGTAQQSITPLHTIT
jgi:hypothetical protein